MTASGEETGRVARLETVAERHERRLGAMPEGDPQLAPAREAPDG
jgi:hypothetical protein